MSHTITLVLGTARMGRASEAVTEALQKLFAEKGHEVVYVDVKDHVCEAVTVPPWGTGGADELPTAWKDVVVKTDSFIFVIPEYNHSFPGEWKLLMDSVYKEYAGKRAYLVTTSSGSFGGARVMESVLPMLTKMQFSISPKRLYVSAVAKQFAADGTFTDPETEKRFQTFVDDVMTEAYTEQ